MNRFICSFLLALTLLPGAMLMAQTADATGKVTLQFPAMPIPQVVDMYERLSGKSLIRDAALPQGNITIVTAQPMDKEDALRFIESSLLLNGVAILPVNAQTAKVVSVQGKPAVPAEEAVLTDLSALPIGDAIVTVFVPLRYADPQAAAALLAQAIPVQAYGRVLPVASARALVITESAPVVRKLASLVHLIDVPPAELTSRFISLKRADAERVVEFIQLLFKDKGTSGSNPSPQQAAQPASDPGVDGQTAAPTAAQIALNPLAAGALSLQEIAASTQLIPDTRTNRILLVATPANFEYVKSLIMSLDDSLDVVEPFNRPLQYVSASEVLSVLADMLDEGGEGANGEVRGGGGGNQTGGNNAGAGNLGSRNTSNTGGQSSSSGGSGGGRGDVLQSPNEDTSPESVIVGKTRIVADKRSNSIIIDGPPDQVQRALSLLELLDQRPRQVYLATAIGQLTVGDDMEFAVDIFRKYGGGNPNASTPNAGAVLRNRSDPAPSAASLITNELLPLAGGLTVYGAIGYGIDVFVKALASTNRFQLLSRPSIYTANNKKATILSGSRIAIPSSTLSAVGANVNNESFQTNITYEEVVLKLEVIPLINEKKEVTLQIYQVNDAVIGSTVINNNEIPTIGTQELSTTVTVPNRATVVLGGLVSDNIEKTTSGIPFFKDIPYLGLLFSNTQNRQTKSELVILIQPTVLDDDSDVVDLGNTEIGVNDVVEPTLRFITFGESSPPKIPSSITNESEPGAPSNSRNRIRSK